jgi:indole-3-glycerol phosphate synthase
MSDFLDEMMRVGLRRVAEVRPKVAELESRAKSASPPLPLEVARPGFDVIAEAKLASPSEGQLMTGDDGSDVVVSLARAYTESGAAAISILTEESRFAGSLAHLGAVASSCPAPVMRKDFLVDPVQILEARAHGASGVLLIARMLTRSLLEEMTDLALAHGMFVVVEVFGRDDLDAAAHVLDREVVVGVNSRDLATLEVDPGRFATVAPHLPDHLPAMAESGLASVEDVVGVVSLGYRLALIGSSLVTDSRPGARLGRLIAAGRAALTGATS